MDKLVAVAGWRGWSENPRRLQRQLVGTELGAMATPALPAKFLQPVFCSGKLLLCALRCRSSSRCCCANSRALVLVWSTLVVEEDEGAVDGDALGGVAGERVAVVERAAAYSNGTRRSVRVWSRTISASSSSSTTVPRMPFIWG